MSLLAGAGLLLLGGTVTGEAARLNFALVSLKSSWPWDIWQSQVRWWLTPAYFWLLDRFPPTLIATHTYVNPLVALVLGWSFAGEVLTASFVLGGLVIIAAIALVERATSRESQALSKMERPAETTFR